ncbi:hypothetical protein BD779DRAFT_1580245, partial [Infundibulicybe gibba]
LHGWTRIGVLEKISAWVKDPNAKNILWINGVLLKCCGHALFGVILCVQAWSCQAG